MASYNDNKTRREIIMKHYSKPIYKIEKLESHDVELFSKQCVDELKLSLYWEQDVVKDAKFSGVGCAVFLSSVDIMLESIIGKTKEEIKILLMNYKNMINQSDKYNIDLLGKLSVFENVSTHLNRLHCAEMIEIAISKIV